MKGRVAVGLCFACGVAVASCGDAKAPERPGAKAVFDAVAPSVVAILNDDRADREAEIADVEKQMGQDARAPKHVIDVSLRKEPMPHGTGFMVAGGLIVTAAHVVLRPDRLKVTTRAGKTVDAELVRLDEARDVAVLRAKVPLPEVPPLDLEQHDLAVGEPVWALGHTGRGLWALAWGMSEGIASGIVDMFGEKLLLIDAAVYPGFSGGPVVTFHNGGRAEVAGVNHAILYTGMSETPMAPIYSAVAVSELRDVLEGRAPPNEAALAAFAAKQRGRTYADLFLTNKLQVTKDENGLAMAHIVGNTTAVHASSADPVDVPCVAMVFGANAGKAKVRFEVKDPAGTVVATSNESMDVELKQRVTFVQSKLTFSPGTQGRHAVVVSLEGKEIGRSWLMVEPESSGDESTHDHDIDALDDREPDVDVVVAQLAQDDPLALLGIRSAWAEKSYPRRVGFTYFVRASRGWSGTNVSVGAWVLDEAGKIVGRSDGCFFPEVRPEHTWQCMNQGGGLGSPPLAAKVGSYDIVFTINARPVAWWPMEAVLKQSSPGSEMEHWLDEMRHVTMPKR